MKIRVFVFLWLLGSFCSVGNVRACVVAFWGNNIFSALRAELQTNPDYLNGKHIVLGRYWEQVQGYGMKLEITTILYGANDLKDTVKIWGDPGWTCRMGMTAPSSYLGDTLFAILEPIALSGGPQTSYESDSDYFVNPGIFGSSWVINDSINGAGFYGSWIHSRLDDFIDSIQQIIQTAASVPGINTQKAGLSVFPNPASDMAYIHSPINGNLSITVFNSAGVCVWRKEDVAHATGDNVQLITTGWSPGLYFVRCIGSDGQIQTCRFIKE